MRKFKTREKALLIRVLKKHAHILRLRIGSMLFRPIKKTLLKEQKTTLKLLKLLCD